MKYTDPYTLQAKINNAAQEAHATAALVAIRPTLLRQPALRKVYNQIPAALRKYASLSLSSYANEVYLNCQLYDLDSFKDERLLKALAPFADWEGNTNDYTFKSPNRDFHFHKEFTWEHDTRSIAYKKLVKLDKLPHHYAIRMAVYAYVKEDSPLCRVVVTGIEEKVVRNEIRQIVCA